jgi:hypothetical protein
MRDFVAVRKLGEGGTFSRPDFIDVRSPFPRGKGLGVRLLASSTRLDEHERFRN